MDLCLIALTSLADLVGPVVFFLIALFGLGVVIFVHELGHFLVAKACGVKCEKFYVGFDVPISLGPWRLPSAFFRRQWGETEYGIGIIPLGGYVKMLGQDDNPANAAREAERIRLAQEEGGDADALTLDPRSYPAKSVPQRMAIISAGVIMNVIFAVIFATIAYRMGVKFIPASISATVPGSPSWEAGMQPGDKILQIGKEGRRDEQLTFDRDLAFSTLKTNATANLEMFVRRLDGTEEWINLRPRRLSNDKGATPKIGGGVPFGKKIFVDDLPTASVAESGLKTGDVIRDFQIHGASYEFTTPYQVLALLRQFPADPMTMTVDRPDDPDADESDKGATSRVELTLPPQVLRETGLRMQMGTVARLRRDSPAEAAGFQEGDRIVTIDGEPVADALRIDQQLAPRAGQSVSVVVARSAPDGSSQQHELSVTPDVSTADGEVLAFGLPTAAESIGLAYYVTDVVDRVLPGSAAEAAGVQPGDTLIDIAFRPAAGSSIKKSQLNQAGLNRIELRQDRDEWPAIFWNIQHLPREVDMELIFDGGGVIRKFNLTGFSPMQGFLGSRGLQFEVLTNTRTAATWSDAVRLGLRETRSGVEQVIFILRNIGALYRNIGGPLAIASVGTQEASAGIPRLLIFLTMLSANLAVLNFLPIPVLDGGHMVFLLYEGLVGKPVNERVAMGLTMAGLCFILTLMVIVFGWDIYRLATG